MCMTTAGFTEWISAVEDRSAALRAAAASAGETAPVPSCPGWTVADLIAHLGQVHRFWAANVAAGPAAGPAEESALGGRDPSGDLLAWSAECAADLIAALRAAGPDRGCWTWWDEASGPATSGAVARHQAQEAAVHAWDAQQAAGRPEPLPAGVALDALDEFLFVSLGSAGDWPAAPARVAVVASEGPSWMVDLGRQANGHGALTTRSTGSDGAGPGAGLAGAELAGTASDLLLAMFGRREPGDLVRSGDAALVSQVLAWIPTD
jgi:uncharacterized protein (TIGR03083 family)